MRIHSRTALVGGRPPITRRTKGREGPVGMWPGSGSGFLPDAPRKEVAREGEFLAVPDNPGRPSPSFPYPSPLREDCDDVPVVGKVRSARAAAPETVRVVGRWG